MRTELWRKIAILTGLAHCIAFSCWGDDTFPPCWRGRPDTTYQQWTFNTAANPAPPESASNPFGSPSATITPGTAAGGWISNNLAILFGPNRTGVWDLGRNGNISLAIPNHAAPVGSWKFIYVQVTQYRDSVYNQLATVAVPGATLVRSQLRTNESVAGPFNGKWVLQQTVWLMETCPASETVTVSSGPSTSSAIDQIVIDTQCSTSDTGDLTQPCWRGTAGATFQNWSFHNSVNPASPEKVTSPGSPQASLTLGPLALGWQDVVTGFGCRQGYWDLGSFGQIVLTIPNIAGSPTSYKYIQLQVTEFQDSLAYNQLASPAIPGAVMTSRTQTTVEMTPTGMWVVDSSLWRIAPCPNSETITLTAPNGSALIDQVVVDTLCVDFVCPTDIFANVDPGQCNKANVTWTLPPVDNCKVTAVSCSPANGSTFPVGMTPVSCAITDGEGGMKACAFIVTIIDNQPPTVTCPADITVARMAPACGATATFTATASDNCPGVTVTCVPPSGSMFPVGSTTVSCTAKDASMNLSAPCTFAVHVVDFSGDLNVPCWRHKPASTYQHWAFSTPANPAAPELKNSPGNPLATVTLGPLALGWQDDLLGFGCKQGYWDLGNSGTISLAVPNVGGSAASFKYIRLQVTEFQDSLAYNQLASVAIAGAVLVSRQQTTIEPTVTGMWVVDESIWRIAPCPNAETILLTAPNTSALIDQIVVDTFCQEIICPGSIMGSADMGLCSKANVSWTLPAVDGCVIKSVICRTNGVAVSNPATFPVGVTTVSCDISDAEAQNHNCTFTVSITDDQLPVALCKNITVFLDASGNVTVTGSQVNNGSSDNCGIQSLLVSPSMFTCANLGPNTVTLTVTDLYGSQSTCMAVVTVADNLPPVITCPANITVNTSGGTCSSNVTYTATATDNCGTATLTCTPASGSAFGLGTTTVNCTTDDAHGNMASCSFTVTVTDTEPPAITCPANITVNTSGGTCSSNVTYTTMASDNCGTANVTCTPASGSAFGLGTTTVNCTANDGHGNTASCSFTVTVVDAEKPVITCPANITVNTSGGTCSSNVTFATTATDNCGTATVTCTPASGSSFGLGTTTVNCTADDGHGNTMSCSFTVTVVDNEKPAITCPANITVEAAGGSCSSNVTFTTTATDNCGTATVTCVPASGSAFGFGVTTVNCTADDGHGNTMSCSFTVTVNDTQPPMITCPANITVNTSGNTCSSNVTFTTTGSDNCGTANVTCTPASGSAFGFGTTTVNCTANDGHGNTASCSFTVTVNDTQPPTITCPANISVNTSGGTCSSNVTFTTTATDNCGTANVTCTPASGTSFGFGTTTVNCTANDGHGNTAPCSFTVTVNDTEPPSITCPANITANAAGGSCSSNVTFTTTASDNCGTANVTCTPASGTPFGFGTTTVNCTANDGHGNTTACSFTVTVNDTQPPSITCPANITVNTSGGTCSSNVTFTTTASDNCGTANVTCTPASGSPFGFGTTTVNCMANDGHGNTADCSFTVTVNDGVPPSITCPANITVSTSGNTCSSNVTFTTTASDNCGTANVTCTPASGSPFGLGTTTVNCTANDGHGNTAACSFTVTVNDTVPPVVTCPANISVGTPAGSCSSNVTFSATATDNCGSAPVNCSPASGSPFPRGVTMVTCTANDGHGNTAVCSFTVTVVDSQPPVLSACPANNTVNTSGGTCSSNVTYTVPTATDNCGSVTVTCSPASGSPFPRGTTTVVCTADDGRGNTATCSFTVTVNDTEPPVITCPANITVTTSGNTCTSNVTYSATATDNCSSPGANCVPASGSAFPVGATTVNCLANDGNGNTASCSFTVTVVPKADLSVQVAASPNPVTVGNELTYTVTLKNNGPCDATGVSLTHLLSPSQTLLMVRNGAAAPLMACPVPGPSAWWRAEGNANDAAGANHGTLNGGATYAAGEVGQGFQFDGLSGYVSVPDAPALRPSSFTIEGWIKITDPNGVHVVVSKPQGASSADSYAIWIASGVLYAALSDGSGSGPFLTYPEFPSSSVFLFSDIVNLPSLANKLKNPAPGDNLSQYLATQLSPATTTLLAAYAGGPDANLQSHIVADFNLIIANGPLYTPMRFSGVTLSPETTYVLNRNPTGADLVRLNRLLIRDAYPTDIVMDLFPQLDQYFHVAYSFDQATHIQALYVNGALVDVGVVNKTITYDAHPLFIGADNNSGSPGFFYQGVIDELALYNRALAGTEIEPINRVGGNGKCLAPGPFTVGNLANGAMHQLTLVVSPTACIPVSASATASSTSDDQVLVNNTGLASSLVQDVPNSQLLLSIRAVSRNSGRLILNWPVVCGPYILQAAPSMNLPITWGTITPPVQVIGNRTCTVFPPTGPHQYYRLIRP